MLKRNLFQPADPMTVQTVEQWKCALEKRRHAELVAFIVEMASANRSVRQTVQSRFDLDLSSEEVIADTRTAIRMATDFDDRDRNTNFHYDCEAYQTVERNFARLLSVGKHAEVMELALKLMSDGSLQAEHSDEGLMCDEIKACLAVVINALDQGPIPAAQVVAWCEQMVRSDRLRCICDQELHALLEKFAHG